MEIINAVVPDPNIFLWTAASVADDAANNPNSIKTVLANGLSTFAINDNPVFTNSPKSLPKNLPGCPILWNWVFYNFTLADEPFAKALGCFEACKAVSNNLCRKLFSSIKKSKYGFGAFTGVLMIFIPVNCAFESWF